MAYAVRCYAMLCDAMRCHAMPCDAMRCSRRCARCSRTTKPTAAGTAATRAAPGEGWTRESVCEMLTAVVVHSSATATSRPASALPFWRDLRSAVSGLGVLHEHADRSLPPPVIHTRPPHLPPHTSSAPPPYLPPHPSSAPPPYLRSPPHPSSAPGLRTSHRRPSPPSVPQQLLGGGRGLRPALHVGGPRVLPRVPPARVELALSCCRACCLLSRRWRVGVSLQVLRRQLRRVHLVH